MDEQLIKELTRKSGLQSYYDDQKEAYQTGREDGYDEAIIKERGGC